MSTAEFGAFRRRLRTYEPLAGTFIKTPSVHATEILGHAGLDFMVIDEEHGPFDRGIIDLLLLAAKASNIAGVVRVADESAILSALDMGAAAVLVPHVNSALAASSAVAASRYGGGLRGFSPSPRAGNYGAFGLTDHIARADAGVSVLVMIEHPDAIANVDAIAAVEGVDALFLGLGDLAVASGESSADTPALRAAAQTVCQTARRHGKAVMATASSVVSGAWLLDLGVTALVINSDQGLLRSAASLQIAAFRSRNSKD